MRLMYVDEDFYSREYLGGATAPFDPRDFRMYAIRATKEVRARTFGNIDEAGEIPDVVRYCCCDLIDRLHMADTAKGKNGMVLQSYENDGESGAFLTTDLVEEKTEEAMDRIIRSWLSGTGLLFCGVKCQ